MEERGIRKAFLKHPLLLACDPYRPNRRPIQMRQPIFYGRLPQRHGRRYLDIGLYRFDRGQ